jgi:hypothetical protein
MAKYGMALAGRSFFGDGGRTGIGHDTNNPTAQLFAAYGNEQFAVDPILGDKLLKGEISTMPVLMLKCQNKTEVTGIQPLVITAGQEVSPGGNNKLRATPVYWGKVTEVTNVTLWGSIKTQPPDNNQQPPDDTTTPPKTNEPTPPNMESPTNTVAKPAAQPMPTNQVQPPTPTTIPPNPNAPVIPQPPAPVSTPLAPTTPTQTILSTPTVSANPITISNPSSIPASTTGGFVPRTTFTPPPNISFPRVTPPTPPSNPF